MLSLTELDVGFRFVNIEPFLLKLSFFSTRNQLIKSNKIYSKLLLFFFYRFMKSVDEGQSPLEERLQSFSKFLKLFQNSYEVDFADLLSQNIWMLNI